MTVAALFVETGGSYFGLPGVDPWDEAREIPGYPGYLVTNDGRVFGRRTNSGLRHKFRQLCPSPDAKGYLGLTICNGRTARRKVRIHRLVAELFLPNPDDLPCVRHLDGNPANNRAENLAWGSYAQNEEDKRRHGTWDTRRAGGKLTTVDRKRARELDNSGVLRTSIAREMGVSTATICRLLNGRTWRGVS